MRESQDLFPLETLFARESGQALPLKDELARLLGTVRLPLYAKPAHVVGNFVTTLDGVVALNVPGHMSGGDISGFERSDQALMGLLRATADAVIIGAGTMRVERGSLLTPAAAAPWLEADYQELRTRLGKPKLPWNVLVTARGHLDLTLPAFQAGAVPLLVITTKRALPGLQAQVQGSMTRILAVQEEGTIAARTILEAVEQICGGSLWLVEGGPRLLDAFVAEQCLHELFLTLAPQIAGRIASLERPGLVAGTLFAPDQACWGELVAVRRSGSHLFLRYALRTR